MSRIGSLYQIANASSEMFADKTTVAEFYQVMGEVITAATPKLSIYETMATWAHALEDHELGSFFVGDFRATSDSDDPWVVVHRPASVSALASAWKRYPIEDVRDWIKTNDGPGRDHILQDLETHSEVAAFLESAAKSRAGLVLLYNP